MNDRIKAIRISLSLTQEEFGNRIGIKSRAHISSLESGSRNITDRIISDICTTYNVNENWLRHGIGDMFKADISLDEFARINNISDLELDIIKVYMRLDPDTRNYFINGMAEVFNKHNIIKMNPSIPNNVDLSVHSYIHEDKAAYRNESDNDIEKELERYRLELEAEKRAKTSGALESGKRKSKLG